MNIVLTKTKRGFTSEYQRNPYKVTHKKKEKIETEETLKIDSFEYELGKIFIEMKKEGYSCCGFNLEFEKVNKKDRDFTDVDLMFIDAEEKRD